MRKFVTATGALAILAGLLFAAPASIASVADSAAEYAVCGRVYSDPHAYWPGPPPPGTPGSGQSPFAKGNVGCKATDFVAYGEMVSGITFMEETLFPQFIEFYNLEQDFGGNDGPCTGAIGNEDYCSAGIPDEGFPPGRARSELYMVRVTDERVPETNKKLFVFPLSIHGIERAGAEAGVRAAEDLATWAYCEAVAQDGLPSNNLTNCPQEGTIPHPLLETQPGTSLTAGDVLERASIYFIFPNADGWRRGDPDNLARHYTRYNGNGVDMNRDWPTIGFTFRPYTPWSEPETKAFGQVLKGIRPQWDGGIDLHGQLNARAFSFTLLGASERDYAKDQRILQTVRGAWADAEERLQWHPLIVPNNQPRPSDAHMYGVQWGTVWDTIAYTVTGSLGDWIDSPLGLGADGIDNEMSFSHISNCGTGTCYLTDFEQLHVDGNKSLVYAMINFTLLPEDQTFQVPGKVGYVLDPSRISAPGDPTPGEPCGGLPTQDPILNVSLDATNSFRHQFVIKGPADTPPVCNGGVEGKATPVNLGGQSNFTSAFLVLERYRPLEPPVANDPTACGGGGPWEEVNRYFNSNAAPGNYLAAGMAVHSNAPLPDTYRICLTGGLATQLTASGGFADLDITFSGEEAWADPGQLAYDVSNMEFFESLAQFMTPGQLVPVDVDAILNGTVDLGQFRSLVIADDALPGFTEGIPSGPAQATITVNNPGFGTVACAYQPGTTPTLPPTCVDDVEFDVNPGGVFNNQSMTVALTATAADLDWDVYLERQSLVTGEWFGVANCATGAASETCTLLQPIAGHYRARVVNWSASPAGAEKIEISFDNQYVGPPIPPSQRTVAERDAWAQKLEGFVQAGGNLVLTDGALRNLAYMNLVPRTLVNNFSAYAGYIGFTRDGTTSTYNHPSELAKDVNQPGAAEGPQFRHQTYEPVPIGFSIQDAAGANANTSPVWSVDQIKWEDIDGVTVGVTTADQVTLGQIRRGNGVIRVIGALVPMPTEQYYHPFGLANYAVTYTGYQVLNNALQWAGPTAVRVTSFSAKARPAGVTVTWRTLSEVGTLGYNVWRFVNGRGVKVNRSLVPAKGQARGATYRVLDRQPGPGAYTYRLQAVSKNGSRSWRGSASVRVRR